MSVNFNERGVFSRGVYIVFEGGEGSGKTTQARLLYKRIKKRLPEREVILTREPGGTFISDQIRTILLTPFEDDEEMEPITEAYLFAASRAESLRKIVKPAIERGAIVIADRSVISSWVYQGYARELGPEVIWSINNEAVRGIFPHKVVLLDMSVENGLDRRRGDGKFDRLDQEELEFHREVRKGYLFLADKEPERFLKVDATLSIEEQREIIWEGISSLITGDEPKRELGSEFRIWKERE